MKENVFNNDFSNDFTDINYFIIGGENTDNFTVKATTELPIEYAINTTFLCNETDEYNNIK